jgi:beta-glucanase (GH16 family)
MTNWAGAFRTYAVDWTATSITFSYDDQTCYTFSNWTPMTGYTAPAPFNQDFFMILQVLADNGVSAPAPDATTALPATMQVDWVRVWK